MKDGVIACQPDATITLFNQAAEDLFARTRPLHRGKSLYDFCCQPPVEHALSLLQYQLDRKSQTEEPPCVQFTTASVGQDQFFRCRLSFLDYMPQTANSFVIIFEDISAWYTPGNPLFQKIESFRAPMANLRAAVENFTEYPEMSPVMRSAFENVLVQESLHLTAAFNGLARSCKDLMHTQNQLTELPSDILFGYVARHLQAKRVAAKELPGKTFIIGVDLHGLLLVLDYLRKRILATENNSGLSCTMETGDQFVYFDLIWSGEFITTGEVKTLLETKLEYSLGEMTIDSILHAMDADIWSRQLNNSQNTIRLAIPIGGMAEK
ncbi:MAG: PAS domain-containing protein [Desulfobulbales bacterium]|nr:PAS domain-containing protein [Desulfobulbales bacterium]